MATKTTIALAALLCTWLSSRYRAIARNTQTVAWTKSATTAARTRPECATTFRAVAAASPETYTFLSTK